MHVPNGFGGRAVSNVSKSHIFPQGVLAAITLVGGGARAGGDRARVKCEPGLLLCPVANITLLGWQWVQSCWSRSPESQVQAGSLPSKCVLSPIPALISSPQKGSVLEQEGLEKALGKCQGIGWGGPGASQNSRPLSICCLSKHQ